MKPRVFVSSIMEGFSEFRSAAKEAIVASECEAVLVEDYPSISDSPRNACLDAVQSCDIFILVIGLRGGYVAPSGKLVIEEEYEEALGKMPILVFIQEGTRDESTQRFIDKVSDYVDGRFRKTFSNSGELKQTITESLIRTTEGWSDMQYDLSEINNKIDNPYKVGNETTLRFVLMPIRKGEFVDAVDLDTDDFERNIYDIAHQRGIDLFSYKEAKMNPEVEVGHVVYMQNSPDYRGGGGEGQIRLEISTGGMVVIDINMTEPDDGNPIVSVLHGSVIHVNSLSISLNKCFKFCAQLFEVKDAYRRFDPLVYNVCLNEMGHKRIVDQYPQGSVSMRMFNAEEEIKAFDEPRKISRNDLLSPEREVMAVISMLKRRTKD